MGKTAVYIFIILSLLCLGLTLVPKGFTQTQSVKIIGYSYYVDESGGLNVVGQVQNVGSSTVNPVILEGTVFAPGGEVASTSATQVWVSYLTPGQKAPFIMDFSAPEDTSGWSPDYISNITLSVAEANATNSYQYPDLKITSSSPFIGTAATGQGYQGAYGVNGVIENTGTQPATNITVVGAFFNSTGNVVGVGYTDYLTPTVLAPSDTTTFQIFALDLNQSQVPSNLKIYSYSLLVQTGGPILQGTPPPTSPPTSGGGSPTSSQSSSKQPATNSENSIHTTTYVIVFVAVVLVVLAGAALVLRRSKPQQTAKEAKKAKKSKTR
jgi:hypothetical protein